MALAQRSGIKEAKFPAPAFNVDLNIEDRLLQLFPEISSYQSGSHCLTYSGTLHNIRIGGLASRAATLDAYSDSVGVLRIGRGNFVPFKLEPSSYVDFHPHDSMPDILEEGKFYVPERPHIPFSVEDMFDFFDENLDGDVSKKSLVARAFGIPTDDFSMEFLRERRQHPLYLNINDDHVYIMPSRKVFGKPEFPVPRL